MNKKCYYKILNKEELERLVNENNTFSDFMRSLGYTANRGASATKLKKYCAEKGVSLEKYQRIRYVNHSHPTISLEEILIKDSKYQNQACLKRRLILSGMLDYKCQICGITEWNGKKISLQLDHINGDNRDNRIENLRFLCPNCHSQTETFCRKKKENKVKQYYHFVYENNEIKEEVDKNYLAQSIFLNGTKATSDVLHIPEQEIIELCNINNIPLEKEKQIDYINNNNLSIKICKNCKCFFKGKKKNEFCSHECSNMYNRKITFERDGLIKELEEYGSYTKVGLKYNVTANAIKRWCDKFNIPRTLKELKKMKEKVALH